MRLARRTVTTTKKKKSLKEYFRIPNPNDPRYGRTRVRPEARQDPYWNRRNPSPAQAERVPGDNDGWHVVGDNKPPPRIGHGVHPEGQQPHKIPSQKGQQVPDASDPRQGYYTDPYGRQLPIRTRDPESRPQEEQLDPYGQPIGEGVQPNQQEIVSFPNGNGEARTAKMHRPIIVKDDFGTVYKPVVIDGQTRYILENQEGNQVQPNPRLVNNARGEELDREQWERQEEEMKKNEEERKKQEEEMKKLEDAEKENESEESVPLEKEEDINDIEEPAKLPPPVENPEEEAEEESED